MCSLLKFLFSWTEAPFSVVSPAADLDGLRRILDSEAGRDRARCNRLRKLCLWLVYGSFRILAMIAPESRWNYKRL